MVAVELAVGGEVGKVKAPVVDVLGNGVVGTWVAGDPVVALVC